MRVNKPTIENHCEEKRKSEIEVGAIENSAEESESEREEDAEERWAKGEEKKKENQENVLKQLGKIRRKIKQRLRGMEQMSTKQESHNGADKKNTHIKKAQILEAETK
ncbi:hypothetical protein PoB_007360300 [Plakobranchus ocellatus]|uniref:Uncharacterized protein n=1 Tax=Plakobranchus ocellatus TaxID=259542 RepID=A0AAV4DRZ7_9GAST|nr:hypothetical protein PoB_007360300 [Plakobranchus ocellatus]